MQPMSSTSEDYVTIAYRILIGIITVLITATFLILCKRLKKRLELFQTFKDCNIPEVEGASWIGGNFLSGLRRNDLVETIDNWHRKLGKTYGFYFGPLPWIMTTDLDLLQRVFVTEGLKHVDRPDYRLPMASSVIKSVSQVQGDEWRSQRRILNPSFSSHRMKSSDTLEEIQKICNLLVDYFEQHPVSDKKRIIDVGYAFKRYSLEVVFRMVTGQEHCKIMKPDDRDLFVDLVSKGFNQLFNLPVCANVAFSDLKKLLIPLTPLTSAGKFIKYAHSIYRKILYQRRKLNASINGGEHLGDKMIDGLIRSFDAGKMDTDTVYSNLYFIILAALETTSNTLAIFFWFMAKETKIQDKLRQALIVEGEEAQYLDWCIKETIRLYPGVPAAVGRKLEHDIEHNGVIMPKGCTIMASIWTIHHSQEYWGEDVEDFRPERFGEPSDRPATRFFGFGHGPRYCIGQSLAMSEMRAIITKILLKYRVDLCPQNSPKKINFKTPNFVHMIIEHKIPLAFIELNSPSNSIAAMN